MHDVAAARQAGGGLLLRAAEAGEVVPVAVEGQLGGGGLGWQEKEHLKSAGGEVGGDAVAEGGGVGGEGVEVKREGGLDEGALGGKVVEGKGGRALERPGWGQPGQKGGCNQRERFSENWEQMLRRRESIDVVRFLVSTSSLATLELSAAMTLWDENEVALPIS